MRINMQRSGSHRLVTLSVQFINVCWLLPLACAAQHWPVLGAPLTLLAWASLLVLAIRLNAGVPDRLLVSGAAEDETNLSPVYVDVQVGPELHA
jgi:hypothetical protein